MNLNEKNLELQVQIWALIGPVIALATVITLYYQGAAQNVVLGLATLVGMLACWWWRTKGLMGALVGITILGAYQFLNQPLDEPLWNIGITFAIALTFLVTALSFEEVETIVSGIQSESSSRLKSLLKLDEKLEKVQSKLQEEKKTLLNMVKERDQELHHQERMVELTRNEIISSQKHNEELLREIYSLKQDHQKEIEQATPVSEELLMELEELRRELTVSQDQLIYESNQTQELKIELARVRQEREAATQKLKTLETQCQSQSDETGYARIEIEMLNEELKKAQQQLEFSRKEQERVQKEFVDQNQLSNALQEKLSIKTQEASAREEERLAQHELLQGELLRIQREGSEVVENYKAELEQLKVQLEAAEKVSIAEAESRTAVENYKAELEQLKVQLEAAGKVSIAEAESRELRRINGLYQQLRLQFEEKCQVLDSTRKELFMTQERLSREIMEQRERQYEGTDYERELQRCLAQLEQEQQEQIKAHHQEVEQLQDLISQMMCCPL